MLFISNPSRQPFEFFYRLAITRDNSLPLSVTIPAGGQVEIGHKWTREQTAYVIKQIERAGGAPVSSVHGQMEDFTGLLYRESYPVAADDIETAHKAVVADQEKRSAIQATRGALGFDLAVNQKGGRERLAKVTEVEVIQDPPPRQKPNGKEIHFKMSVDPINGRSDIKVPI